MAKNRRINIKGSNLVVVDSSTIIAYLLNDRNADLVESFFMRALMGEFSLLTSGISASEVIWFLRHDKALKGNSDTIFDDISSLPIELVYPDRAQIINATNLKITHPNISFFDCFNVALASEINAPIAVSGRDDIKKIAGIVKIMKLG